MNGFFYIVIFIIGIIFGCLYSIIIDKKTNRQEVKENSKNFYKLVISGAITGILFVAITRLIKLNIYNLELQSIIAFVFIVLYLTCIILIAGIDKKNKNIEKLFITYGMVVSLIYLIYLFIVEHSMYKNTIYLILIIVLLIIDNMNLKKKANNSYTINILILILIMLIFSGEYITILTIILTLVEISLYVMINKIKNRKRNNNKEYNKELKIGFMLCITNIVILLMGLIYTNII